MPQDAQQLTPAELLSSLGVELTAATPPGELQVLDKRGLARLLRLASARWGPRPRRELTAYLYRLLDACGVAQEPARTLVKEALDELTTLRDVEELRAEGAALLAPTLPRFVRCGEGFGFVCGAVADVPGAEYLDGAERSGALVRWLKAQPEDEFFQKLRLWELTDWLGEPGYRAHLRRRLEEPHKRGLPHLWEAIEQGFSEGAAPIQDAEGYLVITGEPGAFFGILREKEWGRLQPAVGAPDGRWCGLRPGYNKSSTPCVVEIREGKPARAWDLYDYDELRWALLARGVKLGQKEVLRVGLGEFEQTCWLPAQLERLIWSTCAPVSGWRRRTWSEAFNDIVSVLVAVGELDIQPLSAS